MESGEADVGHFLVAKNEALIGRAVLSLRDISSGRCRCRAPHQRKSQSGGTQCRYGGGVGCALPFPGLLPLHGPILRGFRLHLKQRTRAWFLFSFVNSIAAAGDKERPHDRPQDRPEDLLRRRYRSEGPKRSSAWLEDQPSPPRQALPFQTGRDTLGASLGYGRYPSQQGLKFQCIATKRKSSSRNLCRLRDERSSMRATTSSSLNSPT